MAGFIAAVVPPASATTFADVPTTHWAYQAVQYVTSNGWMSGYSNGFHPDQLLTRLELARTLVDAYAPTQQPDPAITFSDLPATTPGDAYRVANVAVKRNWLSAVNGAFNPTATVSKGTMDRAFVLAMGLSGISSGINKIHTSDGYVFTHSSWIGYYIITNELQMNFDYPSSLEKQEVLASSPVSRAFLAYALWKAKTLAQWQLSGLQPYTNIVLPQMNAIEKQVVNFTFAYIGYPYVYAGEWYRPTGSGYCCGTQLQGGFDCSGFAWWVLKAPAGTWTNVSIRGYTGWSLPERGAAAMIGDAPVRYYYSKLQPGDLLGFNTDGQGTGWQGVDHAGIYLGNGWMIHSSGSRGGVSIDYIGSGSWWYSRLVWGRRLLPTYTPPPPPPPPSPSPSPTPSPSVTSSPSASPTP
ncbi:MAG TPA: NlpC/P60 family protein [Actinomycetota bacterium]|nr:NlpC/P60 family protein [Actinomycetota bacterium]